MNASIMTSNKQQDSFANFINHEEFNKGQPVYLIVYHLTWINLILQILGFGVYHTSIEVYNSEYSFGATTEDVPGIFANKADTNTKLKVKEKIYLGHTLFTHDTIYQLLSIQSSFWIGKSYDPFLKNCNHFTKFLANKLLMNSVSYPTYINRLCKYGTLFASFYPPIRTLYGDIACQVQPKTNQVFDRNSSSSIKRLSANTIKHESCNIILEEPKKLKRLNSSNQQIRDVILDIDFKDKDKNKDKAKSSLCKGLSKTQGDNDTETHQMIKGTLEEVLTERSDTPPSVPISNYKKATKEDFFFEVLLTNKYLQFFEYNMTIIEGEQVDDADTTYKMISEFIESMISADHSLHIQQNYAKSIDLFDKLLSLSLRSSALADNINKYPSSSLIKSIAFPSSLSTMQIFTLKMHHSLHFIYFTQSNYIKQEEEINKILLIDPNDYYAIFGLASIRYSQSKFPEVETLLNEVIHSCKDKDCLRHLEKFNKLLVDMM